MRAAMVACNVAGTLTSHPLRGYAPDALQHATFGEFANDLLLKNGYRGSTIVWPNASTGVGEQLETMAVLSTMHPRPWRSLILWAVADQHQRGRLRDHRDQHRLATSSSMGVLNDKDRWAFAGQRAAFTARSTPPTSIGSMGGKQYSGRRCPAVVKQHILEVPRRGRSALDHRASCASRTSTPVGARDSRAGMEETWLAACRRW
jgi:hypothetical protein